MTLQEKFKDKVLFVKDEQMFNEVTELLKGVGAEFDSTTYYFSEGESYFNYLKIDFYNRWWLGLREDTELTYEQFKEVLKD